MVAVLSLVLFCHESMAGVMSPIYGWYFVTNLWLKFCHDSRCQEWLVCCAEEYHRLTCFKGNGEGAAAGLGDI